jgi:acyl-lipid omega-6 desaturase (Delta-12 desaturase)
MKLKNVEPLSSRSIYELFITFFIYFVCMGLMFSLHSFLFRALLIIPITLIIIRIFVIQHDCGHRALFKKPKTNDVFGSICSVFTYIPYHFWRKTHNHHHRHSGILEHSEIGSIQLMEVEQYKTSLSLDKIRYRLMRAPFFLLLIVPILLPTILYRSPTIINKVNDPSPLIKTQDIRGMHLLNVAILFQITLYFFFLGPIGLFFCLISTYFSFIIGVFLFYIQHNFIEAYVVHKNDWRMAESALQGSSLFYPPKIIRWFFGNIGYHHIHHLQSRIPFYKLKKLHEENSSLFSQVTAMYLNQTIKMFRYTLYDKSLKRLITWKEYNSKYVICNI